MDVRVLAIEKHSVVLSAPLEPNINHRETVFGGSASTLAILSAWSLLHIRLSAVGITSQLVIQRNTMEYKRPILGEFTARATIDDGEQWEQFTSMAARRGRARISVGSVLECAGEVAGEFVGDFVALGAHFKGEPAAAANRSAERY